MLAAKMEKGNIEERVGTSRAALTVGEDPDVSGLEALVMEVGALRREGWRNREQRRRDAGERVGRREINSENRRRTKL